MISRPPVSRRGSVIVTALIFVIVLGALTASVGTLLVNDNRLTHRAAMFNAAFHLAEAGIEMGVQALGDDAMDAFTTEAGGVRRYTRDQLDLGGKTGGFTVQITDQGGGRFLLEAVGTANAPEGQRVSRAIETVVSLTGGGGGPGYTFPYGLVARESIRLNHANPGTKIASYDSTQNFGEPIWGVNTGHEVTVAVQAARDGAFNMNNSNIKGRVRTGGGSIRWQDHPQYPPTIHGPETPAGLEMDFNQVSYDFSTEFETPTVPELENPIVVNNGKNNPYKKKGEHVLGDPNRPTIIYQERFDTNNHARFTIIGEVHLVLKRNVNLHSDVHVNDGAQFHLYAGENIHLKGETTHATPGNFVVHATGGRDVVMNLHGVFAGVINAPDSTVRVHGQGGKHVSEFRGAIVANRIESSNGTEFFYDINLDRGGGGGDSGGSGGDLVVESWREMRASDVTL